MRMFAKDVAAIVVIVEQRKSRPDRADFKGA